MLINLYSDTQTRPVQAVRAAMAAAEAKESRWLSVHRLAGGRLVQEGPARRAALLPSVTWSASGELLAFVNADDDVELLRTPGETSSIVPGPAVAVAFFPDGSQFAISDTATLRIHAVDASRKVRSVEFPPDTDTGTGPRNPVNALAFSPDGRWIACASPTCTVIWDAAGLEVAAELVRNPYPVLDLVWVAPDVLATSSFDGTFRIWQVPDGRELRVLETSSIGFTGITYAPAHEAVVAYRRANSWSGPPRRGTSGGRVRCRHPRTA